MSEVYIGDVKSLEDYINYENGMVIQILIILTALSYNIQKNI